MLRTVVLLLAVSLAVAYDSSELRMLEDEYAMDKRVDTLSRESRSFEENASPLIRFGKRDLSGAPLIRFGRAPEAHPLIRFGKRAPDSAPLIRFGRDPEASPLIRFGKRSPAAPLIRFGPSEQTALEQYAARNLAILHFRYFMVVAHMPTPTCTSTQTWFILSRRVQPICSIHN
nr:FMRFamide-related peptide domain containing protein [Haemonchus contortus]